MSGHDLVITVAIGGFGALVAAFVAYQVWWREVEGPPSDWKFEGAVPPRTMEVFDMLRVLCPTVRPAVFTFVTVPWAYVDPEGVKHTAMGQTDLVTRRVKLLFLADIFATAIFHEWRVLLLGKDVDDSVADAALRDEVRSRLPP